MVARNGPPDSRRLGWFFDLLLYDIFKIGGKFHNRTCLGVFAQACHRRFNPVDENNQRLHAEKQKGRIV
jgi:hypothetical protein